MPLSPSRRKLLLIIGSVLLALIVIAIALPFFIDVNRFRPQIEQQLQATLGRRVQIGAVHFSLVRGAVKVENTSIAEDPAFGSEPFLTAKSLDVGVEVLPLLFSKSLRMDSIALRQPQVRLIRGPGGKWNFSSLGGQAASGTKAGNGSKTTTDVAIGSLKITDGRVLVSSSPRSAPRAYDNVQLHARNISYGSQIPFSASANTPGGGKLKIEGKAGPLNRADAAETPLGANVSIEDMDMGASGFIDPSSGLAGILDFNGTIHSDGKVVRTEGKVKGDRLRLVRGGAPARQPVSFDYATDYDLRRQTGTLSRGDIRLGNAAAKLAGNYQTQGESTVLHMKLNAAQMPLSDLQGLLPALGVVLPGGSSFQGGNVDANLSIDGALNNLVTTGPLNISNARLTGFNLVSKIAGMRAPNASKGTAETLIETLSSNVRVAPEGIRTENLKLILPQLGTITGNGTVASNNALNFKMLAKLSKGGSLLGGVSSLATLGKSKDELPFLIQGTTSNPVFVPDVAGALGKSIGTPQKGVGDMLQGVFGRKKKPPQ
jgi:AsmA protein